MESTPFFLGNQFLQGKEESMDTGTFTLGNIILNRYPALSTLTHQTTEPGRVQHELPATGDGKFRCEGTSMLQLQY